MEHTCEWWEQWCEQCTYEGEWRDDVLRSLIVLEGVDLRADRRNRRCADDFAAGTDRGVRNWDYRFCWLRDATFTLYSLLSCGFTSEAAAWRAWLLRAVAGDPSDLQTMYGPRGERRLTELELTWLPGYESSKPVRIGNAAVDQLQLDVYGEVMDACTWRSETVSRWIVTPGRFSRCSSGTWNTRGGNRTRASGKCADRVVISLTPR